MKIVIERQNLEATLATIRMLPGVLGAHGEDSVGLDGNPKEGGEYQAIEVNGNDAFVLFALKTQGYARVVKVIQ